jgi:hypothetical protein
MVNKTTNLGCKQWLPFKGYIMPDLQVYIIEGMMLTIPGC